MSETGSTPSSRRGDDVTPGRAELVTLVVALVLVLAMVGTIVGLRVASGDAPASVQASASWGRAFERDGTWYLPVEVRNAGDRPTGSVRLDVVRDTGDPAHPEVADLDFDFLAGGETADAWAAFDARPTRSTVEFDVVSITDP